MAQSKVFDYLLSRYSVKKSSESIIYNGLKLFFRLFPNLVNAYHLWFSYPKLGIFNFVFESERPLHCLVSKNADEVIYTFKKRL